MNKLRVDQKMVQFVLHVEKLLKRRSARASFPPVLVRQTWKSPALWACWFSALWGREGRKRHLHSFEELAF